MENNLEIKAKAKAKELVEKCSKNSNFLSRVNNPSRLLLAKNNAILICEESIKELELFPYNTIFYERVEFWKKTIIQIETI